MKNKNYIFKLFLGLNKNGFLLPNDKNILFFFSLKNSILKDILSQGFDVKSSVNDKKKKVLEGLSLIFKIGLLLIEWEGTLYFISC